MNHYRKMISRTLASVSNCKIYGWSEYNIHHPPAAGYFCLITNIRNYFVEVSYTRRSLSGVTYGPDKLNYTRHFPEGDTHGQFL